MNEIYTDSRPPDSPQVLSIDLETYSSADLSKCGVYRYVEADDFEILLLAYAFDEDEVRIVDMACGESVPQEIWDAIDDPGIIKAAWNAQFERTCIGHYLGRLLSPDGWQCSMIHAASLSLPLALRNAALVLKTGEQKDRAGENLIKYFSVPCKPTKSNGGRTRNLPQHDPEGWRKFKDYCLQDVRTERDIRKRLEAFPMPEAEWNYYHMDQRINDRGVRIDTVLVQQAIACDLMLSDEMTKKAYELTGLENPNSVSQLKQWLEEKGIPMESLGKKDVAAMITELDKNGCDQEALDMLKLRLQMAKSSVKKYQAAERYVNQDGRAKGLFQFYGANRTGRFSGRGIQLQNLPQNHISTLDEARELVKMGCFEAVEMLYGNTPDVLSQLIRTMLVPKEGCEFIVADFSAIEARVLAWEADEQWRLDAFEKGADIYCESASQMFHVPVVKHGVNGDLRQKGKVAELACIARNSRVLTSRGLVPIQEVTIGHLVWDGVEWVHHQGLILKGQRPILYYDGLSATPEHLVYVEGKDKPVPFSYAAAQHLRLQRMDRHGYSEDVYYGFSVVYDLLNAGPRHRFIVDGCLVHNCGYGGSVGALISMGALDMGLKESELPDLIQNWREANPKIVQYWWDVEKAAVETVKTHKEHSIKRIRFRYYSGTLWMVLPSGRKLAYLQPKLQPNRFGRMSLTFCGTGANNKWQRQETYSGKLVENCIAEGTEVLTDRGLIAIEKVMPDDLLWDGVEWVPHEGLIDKGMQETVIVSTGCGSGLHMTAGHKILTEKGWCECGKSDGLSWAEVWTPHCIGKGRKRQAPQNTLAVPVRMRKPEGHFRGFITEWKNNFLRMFPFPRFNRADLSFPDSIETGREHKAGENAMAVQMCMRKRNHCSGERSDQKKISNKVMRLYVKAPDLRASKDTWDEQTSGMGGVAFDETAVPGPEPSCLPQLRRAWNYSVPGVAGQFRAFLGRYGFFISSRIRNRPDRQQQGLLCGKLPMDNQKDQFQKQENQSCDRYAIWKNDRSSTGGTDRNRGNDFAVPIGSRLAGRISVRPSRFQERVYDIRNCGPRHRFCVFDRGTGKLRIVSNCTQAIARDILTEAMWRLEKAGFEIVGHVHDEVIIEAPIGKYTPEDICKVMAANPRWCMDLPLAAAGYRGDYYFKD